SGHLNLVIVSLGSRSRNQASPNTWSSDAGHRARDGSPSCAIMLQILPPWTSSSSDDRFRPPLCNIRIERRDLVWINVTKNPTAEWVARQITDAFPWDWAPVYMIRDRDRIYGGIVTRRLRAMGIRDKPTAPVSPWQNGFTERLIGSIRRECLDHIVVFGEAHLRRILKSYTPYYNE